MENTTTGICAKWTSRTVLSTSRGKYSPPKYKSYTTGTVPSKYSPLKYRSYITGTVPSKILSTQIQVLHNRYSTLQNTLHSNTDSAQQVQYPPKYSPLKYRSYTTGTAPSKILSTQIQVPHNSTVPPKYSPLKYRSHITVQYPQNTLHSNTGPT